MHQKKLERIRRGKRTRTKIKELDYDRLCIYRTPKHIYAQVTRDGGSQTLAAASTTEAAVREQLKSTGNVDAAQLVGKLVAERAVEQGVSRIAFDRSGYRYHGRVKALADAARENGLKF